MTQPTCATSSVSSYQFNGGLSLTVACPTNITTFAFLLNVANNLFNENQKIGDSRGRIIPTEKPRKSYDFVVIGAGAAGAAVAARLSEIRDWNVLLLEAGPDEPSGAEIPSNFGTYLKTAIDWNFKTSNETHACLDNNGVCIWPRGRNLGGTTVHHGMAYHRGNARDYENWVEMGNEGWSWHDVIPFFIKSENNGEIHRVGDKIHGTHGPMTVERFPYQPPFIKSILEAAVETGYGTTEDLVGKKILGFNVAQTISKNGVRQSSASAFLRPVRHRKNLDIIINAPATKIITKHRKVIGVEYFKNGKYETVFVKKEVVVSGGAVNSPQLLLLSGIGPKEQLEALKIPVVLDLPGVGKNLHNHVSYNIDFTLDELNHYEFTSTNVLNYLNNQTGPLSSSGLAQITAILASKYTTKDYPDIQMFFSGYQASCKTHGDVDLIQHGNNRTVRFIAVNLHPKSRGVLSLASSNPLEHPIIFSNDLGEPEDVDVLIEGLHVVLNIANSTVMRKKGITIVEDIIEQCKQYEYLTDEYFKCAVHYNTRTENHQGGSCKMGPARDKLAVVDPKLRVHGIKGLRVADASIVPRMISGNPHATMTMIGERAADFIKKSYSRQK